MFNRFTTGLYTLLIYIHNHLRCNLVFVSYTRCDFKQVYVCFSSLCKNVRLLLNDVWNRGFLELRSDEEIKEGRFLDRLTNDNNTHLPFFSKLLFITVVSFFKALSYVGINFCFSTNSFIFNPRIKKLIRFFFNKTRFLYFLPFRLATFTSKKFRFFSAHAKTYCYFLSLTNVFFYKKHCPFVRYSMNLFFTMLAVVVICIAQYKFNLLALFTFSSDTITYFIVDFYMSAILFMLVLLTLLLLSYPFFGYETAFYSFMLFFLFLLPLSVLVLFISIVRDFSVVIPLKSLLIFSGGTFDLFSFRFDGVSCIFSATTLIIGFFTFNFQYFYMFDDAKKGRFFFFMGYFMLSMLFFVHSANFIVLLMGWELLGITSFFLIAHYDYRNLTLKSALKVFCFNSFSDLFIILALVLTYFDTGSFDFGYGVVNGYSSYISRHAVLMSLVIAAFIKSAQFIFFFWLPDSMEAPVPASALIHSATLVSAGLYLLLRFKNDIMLCPSICNFIVCSSSITALLITPMVFLQTDLKRLLALSTIVNVSFMYMMLVLVDSTYTCVYFVMHGLFKSCSFLLLGVLILANKHSQDYRSFRPAFNIPLYMGFSFIVCVLFLSGINIVFSYNIKHIMSLRSSTASNYYWVSDLIFIIYSCFSSIYGLKVLFFLGSRNYKCALYGQTNIGSDSYKYNFYINNLLTSYLLLSIVITCAMFYLVFVFDVSLSTCLRKSVSDYSYVITAPVFFPVISAAVYVVFNDRKYSSILFVYTTFIMLICLR